MSVRNAAYVVQENVFVLVRVHLNGRRGTFPHRSDAQSLRLELGTFESGPLSDPSTPVMSRCSTRLSHRSPGWSGGRRAARRFSA